MEMISTLVPMETSLTDAGTDNGDDVQNFHSKEGVMKILLSRRQRELADGDAVNVQARADGTFAYTTVAGAQSTVHAFKVFPKQH